MKLLSCAIICVVFVSCIVQCVKFTDCGSKIGKFSKVTVTDCNESQSRCILKRGSSPTLTIEFKLNYDKEVTGVRAVCQGKVWASVFPFPLPNPNACVNSGLTCPLNNETVHTYTATLYVSKYYPSINVDVKFQLKNKADTDIVCIIAPARIG